MSGEVVPIANRVPDAICAPQMEVCVLGAMLFNRTAIECAAAMLTPYSFYDHANAQLFTVILKLHNRGSVVDPPLLFEELTRTGLTDAVGGAEYIFALMDAVPTAANVVYHAGIVRERALQRRLADQRKRLAEVREDRSVALDEALDELLTVASAIRDTQTLLEQTDKPTSLRILTDTEIEKLETPAGILGEILFERSLAVLFGPPGSGKSFVALDWSLSMSTGLPWLGRGVKHAPVLYVAPEGSAGLGARIRAWKETRGVPGAAGTLFVPQTISLLEGAAVDRLIRAARALPHAPGLVVFDTLARSMPGGDENSATDMGSAIAQADRIREELGCTVLLVHHTNAGGERERGSTALRGAADTMVVLMENEDGGLILECVKAKDAAPFQKVLIRLKPTLESCVVITAKDGWQLSQDLMPPKYLETLESLPHHFGSDEVPAGKWLEVATGVPKRTFYRAIQWLQETGYVSGKKVGRAKYYRITQSGQDAITATTANHCQTTAKPTTATTATDAGVLGPGSDGSNAGGRHGPRLGLEEYEEEYLENHGGGS